MDTILVRDEPFSRVVIDLVGKGERVFAVAELSHASLVLANLLASLWSALVATRQDVKEFLKDQAPGSTGFRLASFQRLLIVSQISVSVIVLLPLFILDFPFYQF